MKNLKVALCCIAKEENKYIREFIQHYYDLGFDKIYIYDNNNLNGERFDDILSDYISDGFVKIIDYRGKERCQLQAYKECYNNFNEFYDWIAFYDVDEFLTFVNPNMNIKTFLGDEKYKDVHGICVNWRFFDDNGNIYFEDFPVKIRFPNPKEPIDFKIPELNVSYNCHIKTILKCGLKNIEFSDNNQHILLKPNHNLKFITPNGRQYPVWQSLAPIDYEICCLNHYSYKTIEEYIEKMKKGYPDQPFEEFKKNLTIKKFFQYNELTNEKIEFLMKNI